MNAKKMQQRMQRHVRVCLAFVHQLIQKLASNTDTLSAMAAAELRVSASITFA
jgi:hypothetical protein